MLKLHRIVKYIKQIINISFYLRDIINRFCLKKVYSWLFLRHCQSHICQTLNNYNLDRDLHCHFGFDDLDFVSGSQACQKYKLQIVFRLLFTRVQTVHGCYTIKKISTVLCVTGVSLRDITLFFLFNFALECELSERLLIKNKFFCVWVFFYIKK